MSNKMKNQDKNNKIAEIDDHIRRNFDIMKVSSGLSDKSIKNDFSNGYLTV